MGISRKKLRNAYVQLQLFLCLRNFDVDNVFYKNEDKKIKLYLKLNETFVSNLKF